MDFTILDGFTAQVIVHLDSENCSRSTFILSALIACQKKQTNKKKKCTLEGLRKTPGKPAIPAKHCQTNKTEQTMLVRSTKADHISKVIKMKNGHDLLLLETAKNRANILSYSGTHGLT